MTSRSGSTPVQCRDGEGALPHEHAEAVEGARAPLLGGPQQRGARRGDDDVGDDESRPQAVELEVDEGAGVTEADGRRVDEDVRRRGHRVRPVPRDEDGGDARAGRDHPGELLAASFVAVDDEHGCRTGQCRLDGDRARRAPGAEDDDLAARGVDDRAERADEPLAVGVVADELRRRSRRPC